MARLRLTYDDMRAIKPDLIYVGAYGFSQQGPYAAKPAYDDLIQGMVALPSIVKQAGADRPRFVPSTIADRVTGLNAVNAVTTALFHRERTGRGQAIEVSMFECLAQFVLGDHMAGATFEPPLGPMGYTRLLADPHLNQTGFFTLADHPSEGTLRSMGIPSRWSESTPDAPRPAPRLGEHSVEVLREAGYPASEIEAMIAAGVTLTVN